MQGTGSDFLTDSNGVKFTDERRQFLVDLVNVSNIPKRTVEYCAQFADSETRLIGLDELSACSTGCGDVPNAPFDAKVIDYLKEHAGAKVLVEGGPGDRGEFSIGNMAVQWKAKTDEEFYAFTNQFSEMIYANGGSLRCEENNEDMWDCYESE